MISAAQDRDAELPAPIRGIRCVDNPREGFSNLFDTHPSVEARVAVLVKFAGGHDPGPLALPPPSDAEPPSEDSPNDDTPVGGPWGADPNRPNEPNGGEKANPLPGPLGGPLGGPWGPTRQS
jgi:heat shock protein HtpX